ncbi:MAG: DUF4258 domain-containing protein [Bacteroidota bacterium]
MQPKNVIFTLALVLVILAIIVSRIRHEPRHKEIFNRDANNIVYTPTAVCQMKCFSITEKDVAEIIGSGIINFSQSNRQQACPTFTIQGRLGSGATVVMVIAQCRKKSTVVHCAVLRAQKNCDCD